MKLKVTGFQEITGESGIRLDATKTDWDDLPYYDKDGKWQNTGKIFTVAFEWSDNPITMGESLNAGLQQLLELVNET